MHCVLNHQPVHQPWTNQFEYLPPRSRLNPVNILTSICRIQNLTEAEGVLHLEGVGQVDDEPGVDLLQDLLLCDHHRLPLPLLDPLLLQLLASIPDQYRHQIGEEVLLRIKER